eukprot:Polyplicarium_translucidae@DN3218_c0_g1_i12.p2
MNNNHFSNACANFLVRKTIPDYILKQHETFAKLPLGSFGLNMIKTFDGNLQSHGGVGGDTKLQPAANNPFGANNIGSRAAPAGNVGTTAAEPQEVSSSARDSPRSLSSSATWDSKTSRGV